MVFAVESGTAAVHAVGYNIADGRWWQLSSRPRVLKQIGLVGSVNGGDMTVEVFFGTQKVGEWRNTLGGAAAATLGLTDDHMISMSGGYVCKAGVPINVMVKVAATTNPVIFGIDMQELSFRSY